MSDCKRCGLPLGGPDNLHTCTPAVKTYSGGKAHYVEPEEHNIAATVFVFRCRSDGKVVATYTDRAHLYQRTDYEHLATLEPRLWIEAHYADVELLERRQKTQYTHSENCWSWGPAHYECALRKIGELVNGK
jgi:hypothetical protein